MATPFASIDALQTTIEQIDAASKAPHFEKAERLALLLGKRGKMEASAERRIGFLSECSPQSTNGRSIHRSPFHKGSFLANAQAAMGWPWWHAFLPLGVIDRPAAGSTSLVAQLKKAGMPATEDGVLVSIDELL